MSLEGSDHTHATTARAAARSTSSTSANPVDLARQIKALVEQYDAARAVKEMASRLLRRMISCEQRSPRAAFGVRGLFCVY